MGMNIVVSLKKGQDGDAQWAKITRRDGGKGLSGSLFVENHWRGTATTGKKSTFPVVVSSSVLFQSQAKELFAAWAAWEKKEGEPRPFITNIALALEPCPKAKGGEMEPDEAGF